MEAPEFFVLQFRQAQDGGGKVRINFAGQQALKFPRMELQVPVKSHMSKGFIAHFAASSTRTGTTASRR